MKETFDFYTQLNNDFFANFGKHVEANSLDKYLQNEIRPRLFDTEYCKTIEKNKRQFLAEGIKLEQFIEENKFEENFINDLSALKKVSDAIYDLLQSHWEFFKYEKSVAQNGVIVAFILEIDQVSIRWDSYLEKYLAISTLLKVAEGETKREGFSPLMVQYHLPENTTFPIEMTTHLVQFLMLTYEFVIRTHGKAADENELEISTLEVKNPVNCVLMVPRDFVDSYQKFLRYCTVDVLKRETLLKYVMETVRLQQGVEMPKATVTNYQKKIAKLLNDLHPEGYLSVNYNEAEDSVDIMTALCSDLDRLEVEYKDMLTGTTDRLARNRKQNLADMTSSAIKMSDLRDKTEKSPSKDGDLDEKTVVTPPPDKDSTVKIDIKAKEHISYLTAP